MAVDLTNHPGANPNYMIDMSHRRAAMAHNKAAASMGFPMRKVPKQPNKYVPHIGAKQRAKGAKA